MRRIRSMRPASWFIQKEVYIKNKGYVLEWSSIQRSLGIGFLIRSRDTLYHDLSEVTL